MRERAVGLRKNGSWKCENLISFLIIYLPASGSYFIQYVDYIIVYRVFEFQVIQLIIISHDHVGRDRMRNVGNISAEFFI